MLRHGRESIGIHGQLYELEFFGRSMRFPSPTPASTVSLPDQFYSRLRFA